MANDLRFQVVGEAFKKKPLDVKAPSERPCEYFAKHVFNREKMYKYLPKDVYDKMVDVIDNGARLDRQVADAVAAGMMEDIHRPPTTQVAAEGTCGYQSQAILLAYMIKLNSLHTVSIKLRCTLLNITTLNSSSTLINKKL